jgi:hypothetical protein
MQLGTPSVPWNVLTHMDFRLQVQFYLDLPCATYFCRWSEKQQFYSSRFEIVPQKKCGCETWCFFVVRKEECRTLEWPNCLYGLNVLSLSLYVLLYIYNHIVSNYIIHYHTVYCIIYHIICSWWWKSYLPCLMNVVDSKIKEKTNGCSPKPVGQTTR